MKKSRIGLVMFGLLAGGLTYSMCGAQEADQIGITIPYEENQLYAVAYLGYEDTSLLDTYLSTYDIQGDLPIHHLTDAEYYLIIPRYEGMEMKLYQAEMELEEPILRYEDPSCEPFIVGCNVSDIFPDAVIAFTYDGETVEFSPFTSLKDGSIIVGDRGLNLTVTE